MPYIISKELRYARVKMFIEIAEKNKWRLTPASFLKSVNGSKRLVNNMLYLARRSGYVNVETVLDGRNVICWNVKMTGKVPAAPAITVSALAPPKGRKTEKTIKKPTKTKVASVDHSDSNKLIAKAFAKGVNLKTAKLVKVEKTPEQIKAENLEKMKTVTAKRAKPKKEKSFLDDIDSDEGITTTYSIDPAWDSNEGIDIKKLVA